MSRNLCQTDCDRCGATPVLIEKPRAVTRDEVGIYFGEYKGLIVANADCPECGAKYLAWIDERGAAFQDLNRHCAFSNVTRDPDPEIGFFDLSYRSSFNDEPGEDDLPPYTPPLVVRIAVDDACVVQVALLLGMQIPTSTEDEQKALARVHEAIAKAQQEQKNCS